MFGSGNKEGLVFVDQTLFCFYGRKEKALNQEFNKTNTLFYVQIGIQQEI
jgi:hypothetical protein